MVQAYELWMGSQWLTSHPTTDDKWGSILSKPRQYRKHLHLFSHLHLCVLIIETRMLLTGSKTASQMEFEIRLSSGSFFPPTQTVQLAQPYTFRQTCLTVDMFHIVFQHLTFYKCVPWPMRFLQISCVWLFLGVWVNASLRNLSSWGLVTPKMQAHFISCWFLKCVRLKLSW